MAGQACLFDETKKLKKIPISKHLWDPLNISDL